MYTRFSEGYVRTMEGDIYERDQRDLFQGLKSVQIEMTRAFGLSNPL